MADQRQVQVHLLPDLVPAGGLRGATAVAIDALRSTTTMITALVAGCTDIRPCGTVEEARELAGGLRAGRAILGGEKHNLRIEGFDLGNSPLEYTAEACQGKTLVITTSNGVHAVLRAVEAERVLVAGFVNFSAVCEELRQDPRPIHILCAGTDGAVTLEDTLLAGGAGGLSLPEVRRPVERLRATRLGRLQAARFVPAGSAPDERQSAGTVRTRSRQRHRVRGRGGSVSLGAGAPSGSAAGGGRGVRGRAEPLAPGAAGRRRRGIRLTRMWTPEYPRNSRGNRTGPDSHARLEGHSPGPSRSGIMMRSTITKRASHSRRHTWSYPMTQLEAARKGIITDEMHFRRQARGPRRRTDPRRGGPRPDGHPGQHRSTSRKRLEPMGIGVAALCKINANIGNSAVTGKVDDELEKLHTAVHLGADTVMDLSTGGDIDAIRQAIIDASPVPIGTVPIYQIIQNVKDPADITPRMMLDMVEHQAQAGRRLHDDPRRRAAGVPAADGQPHHRHRQPRRLADGRLDAGPPRSRTPGTRTSTSCARSCGPTT